jgi:hypothetical protein
MKLTWNMRLALILAVLRGELLSARVEFDRWHNSETMTLTLNPSAEFKKKFRP